jgi:hypothetical protein
MPERAAEARLALDDTREELIAKAAGLWTSVHSTAGNRSAADGAPDRDAGSAGDPGLAVGGDLPGFLAAYYRRVAIEDLIVAGPARLALTAHWHAALGANRPQGRAAVRVRP